ncbi:hypothetical protein [Streptomyces sp. NPDC020917]|uniref:hypothetical protein n=1 Tax=Streptomyces sp. NPDC020917 TaxID=3365102 RepID=UPI00378FCEC6
MTIPRRTTRGRTSRGLLVGLVAAATAAALPGAASADAAPAAPAAEARSTAVADAASVTLVTGQKVTVTGHGSGPASYLLQPAGPGDDGVVSWELGAGADHYVVPIDALPFLGRGLDASLFDVTALARDARSVGAAQTRTGDPAAARPDVQAGARIPVTLAFTAGTSPTAPPGVTLTSVTGSTAQGYLDPGSGASFARALRQRIGADVAAGRKPGSTPLFGGLTSLAVVGAPTAAAVTPHYPLHILQLTSTDALGAPADGDAIVVNNDAIAREAADVPIAGGIGRVAVPAGDYTVATIFPTWDEDGHLTDLRQVTQMDVTVPDTGAAAVALDARTATASVSLHTPRPSVREVTALDLERVDATGQSAVGLGVESWSDAAFEMAPAAAPSVGRAQFRARFDTVATDPADAYRYDLAFSADHIDADQAYTADPRLLATVHHRFSADPAADPGASLLAGPFDSGYLPGTEEVSGYTFLTLPQRLTEYVQTYPGSTWSETVSASTGMIHGEARAFAGGATYDVDWLHGPLAPTLGVHHTDGYDYTCLMCTAGPVALLGYETLGDSTPDHLGFSFQPSTLTAYVDGQLVAENGYPSAVLTGVPTGAATYRVVLTTDSGGDPGVSQSTHTVTDLTVHSPAVPDPGSALPPTQACQGGADGTPCQILPALDLHYDLATDPANTSSSPVQAMAVTVGHLTYDGKGSTAPITSLEVRVSFDGGTTWHRASVSGAHGHYAARWDNPASAAGTSPMLQVTAKDTLGGSVTQTVTDAYTIAAAPAHGH